MQHHAQPTVVSITQSTELGAVYTADEVAELCDAAHRMGMLVHMDGARIANATAALGGSVAALRSFTVDAGVDVISFGGTKAGLAFGEAVVFLDPALAARAMYVRKQVNQLSSKMRFVAAQFNALLHDDLWIRAAEHANAMTQRLYRLTDELPTVAFVDAPQVNSLFPSLPPAAIEPLREWCFFWDWDVEPHQVRWMTSWDTTVDDVERFAAGVRHLLATEDRRRTTANVGLTDRRSACTVQRVRRRGCRRVDTSWGFHGCCRERVPTSGHRRSVDERGGLQGPHPPVLRPSRRATAGPRSA